MKRKRLLLLCIASAMVAALSGLFGTGWAWVNGEPFYRGRSASYWSKELGRWESMGIGMGQCVSWVWHRPVKDWEFSVADRVPSLRGWLLDDPPILAGDKKALGVLSALLADANPQVRRMAAQGLGRLEDNGRPAVPVLVKRLSDPDVDVRDQVEDALFLIAPEVAKVHVIQGERYTSHCHPIRAKDFGVVAENPPAP